MKLPRCLDETFFKLCINVCFVSKVYSRMLSTYFKFKKRQLQCLMWTEAFS